MSRIRNSILIDDSTQGTKVTPANYSFIQTKQLEYPNFQLNKSIEYAFADNLFVAHLIHAFKAKDVLDLGCYLGGLALHVNDLLISGKSDCTGDHVRWDLVDNFDFLKLIDCWIRYPDTPVEKLKHVRKILHQWKDIAPSHIFAGLDIPLSPATLRTFLETVSSRLNSPHPNIRQIETSIDLLKCRSYDIIIFDLSSNETEINLQNFDSALGLLKQDGVMILDDVSTNNPEQLMLFVEVLKKYNLQPIAFNDGKVALTRSGITEEVFNQIHERIWMGRNDKFYTWGIGNLPNQLKFMLLDARPGIDRDLRDLKKKFDNTN
jgi:hypothetical protein